MISGSIAESPAIKKSRMIYAAMSSSLFIHHLFAQSESLRCNTDDYTHYCLCLDDSVFRELSEKKFKNIVPVRLHDLEKATPSLESAKTNRSLTEYFFTLKAAWCLFVLAENNDASALVYLDSDLCCYADPRSLLIELGDANMMLFPHHFEGADSKAGMRGRYCAGALMIRNTTEAKGILEWWFGECLKRCSLSGENRGYGDQSYLDVFPINFRGVIDCPWPAGHVGPWNFQLSNQLSMVNREYFLVGRPLVFFHFHGFRLVYPWLMDCGVSHSGLIWNAALVNLYGDYARRISNALRQIDLPRTRLTSRPEKDRRLNPIDFLLTRRVYARISFAVRINLWPCWKKILSGREAVMRALSGSKNQVRP